MRPAYLYIAILLLSLPGYLSAQKKFIAYQVTGKVSYTIKNNKHSLKIGKVIPETATVQVGDNSTVLLICEQASKPITLYAGTYKLSVFNGNCDVADQSVTAKYLEYVWWQMTNPRGSAADEKNKNTRSAGAVSRGCPGIDFLVPDTLNYYKEDILLRWKVYTPGARKEFMLYMDENSLAPLLVLPVKDDELHLDSLKKWITPGVPFYWNISLDGNEVCPRKLVQVWDDENFREFMDSASMKLIPGIQEAEKDYLLGYMLEQDLFTGEAYKFYKKAKKTKPGDDRYQRTVARFKQLYKEEED